MRISDWSSDVCSSDLTCARRRIWRRGDLCRRTFAGGEARLLYQFHPGERRRRLRAQPDRRAVVQGVPVRSEEHTSELQSLMRISYAVFCLKKKKKKE